VAGNLRSVLIGEMIISNAPDDVLVAHGLGSCVAICLYDPLKQMGGMLHALLPGTNSGKRRGKPTKYVDLGTELLVAALVKKGARLGRLRAYLSGGAHMLSSAGFDSSLNIGEHNVLSAKAALKDAGIRIRAQDTGGSTGRTVKLHIANGQVIVKTLKQGEQTLKTKRRHAPPVKPRAQEIPMATVMITDDSLFIRNKLAKLLAQKGYETLLAGDGVEAVRVYRESKPDVVLMDITMPRKNGLDALSEILQFDPRARVIMLTALDQKSVAATAIMTGAKDFLAKPVRSERLIMTLEKVLR